MSDSDPSIPKHLGQVTQYAARYDPSVLEFIPRARARAHAGLGDNAAIEGYDRWVAHELMWRNQDGEVVVGRLFFEVDSRSTCIVESKSLKLYLFGLAFRVFRDPTLLCQQVEADLRQGLLGEVRVWIEPCPDTFEGHPPRDLPKSAPGAILPAAAPLSAEDFERQQNVWTDDASVSQAPCAQTFFTHTFRSLCPVTKQPDFATVQVHMVAAPIKPAILSAYLATFFSHAAFHEACVESIFAYIEKQMQPTALMVRACFTRRGGIDINPLRTRGVSPFMWSSAWRQ